MSITAGIGGSSKVGEYLSFLLLNEPKIVLKVMLIRLAR